MRDIGQRLQTEQNLSSDEINFLIGMAQAILRAFTWTEGQPMRCLAQRLELSPTTCYAKLRLVVQLIIWVQRGKQSFETLMAQLQPRPELADPLGPAYAAAQAEGQRLKQALSEAQAQVVSLQAKVAQLHHQWALSIERLIVVLKLSGRCTVRSIVEVLADGLGVSVSVGYVQGIIAQAGRNAHLALARLLPVVPLSGAICVDEVFFKEIGRRMLGVVIVDPMSGLILRLQRCTERSKTALGTVLEQFAEAGFKDKIKLCLTDMYAGYLKPVKTYLPQAVHQLCWFHINCFHIGLTVYRANQAYERAVKALAAFDQHQPGPLDQTQSQQRQDLLAACHQTHSQWQGAQRFQRLLLRCLWSPTLSLATTRLDQLLRLAPQVNNPYIQTMGTFLADHRPGLLVFYTCLESDQHRLHRLSRSQQHWVPLTKRWALPLTTNAAEHVFRCLRRYTHQMDHFATEPATQHFFDLFAFFHNVHRLRAGKRAGHSLLTAAHVDVLSLFGTDDPYTILGFPPASQTFTRLKSVQLV
jgi:hypothetical protein